MWPIFGKHTHTSRYASHIHKQVKLRRHALVDPVHQRVFFFFAFSRPSILDSGLGRIGIESNMFLERFFQPHKNSLPTKSLFQGLQSDFNVMVYLMLDHAIAHPVLSLLPVFSLWHDNGGMGYL